MQDIPDPVEPIGDEFAVAQYKAGSPELKKRLEEIAQSRMEFERGAIRPAEPQSGTPQPQAEDPEPGSNVSLDSRALAIYIENPDWTKKRIAKELGCEEKSLRPKRCPTLAAAIAARKAPDPGQRRGKKDDDGNLEAWEPEAERRFDRR